MYHEAQPVPGRTYHEVQPVPQGHTYHEAQSVQGHTYHEAPPVSHPARHVAPELASTSSSTMVTAKESDDEQPTLAHKAQENERARVMAEKAAVQNMAWELRHREQQLAEAEMLAARKHAELDMECASRAAALEEQERESWARRAADRLRWEQEKQHQREEMDRASRMAQASVVAAGTTLLPPAATTAASSAAGPHVAVPNKRMEAPLPTPATRPASRVLPPAATQAASAAAGPLPRPAGSVPLPQQALPQQGRVPGEGPGGTMAPPPGFEAAANRRPAMVFAAVSAEAEQQPHDNRPQPHGAEPPDGGGGGHGGGPPGGGPPGGGHGGGPPGGGHGGGPPDDAPSDRGGAPDGHGNPDGDDPGHNPRNDDHYSDDDKDTRLRKPREADEIKVPPYPQTISAFNKWRRDLTRKVTAASGKGQRCTAWIAEPFKPGYTPDDFAQVETQWASLDAKLADALGAIVQGELATRIATIEDECLGNGTLPSGRLILCHIVQEFRPNDMQPACNTAFDVINLKILNINGLAAYVARWDALRQRCKTPISEMIITPTFAKNVAEARGMGDDMRIWKRMTASDPDHTYAWLRAKVDLQLDRERENRQRAEYLAHELPDATAYTVANKGNGKKGGGKGKKGE